MPIDTAIFARYMAFQLPGMLGAAVVLLLLVQFDTASPLTAMGLFALWVVKDLAFYPFVKVAYEPRNPMNQGVESLIGRTGTTREALEPDGYVRIGAELWRARAREGSGCIPADCSVRVVDTRNLTLIVTAENDEAP